jgi:hypothetical protein
MLCNRHRSLLGVVLLALMLSSVAMAQYAISSSVISGGGSNMSGTSYGIKGSVGQAFTGASSNASYADSAGFWYTTGHASTAAVGDRQASLPGSFSLMQNYPNPFNPTTEIRFEVPNLSHVTIKVFNIEGQLVETLADQEFNAGAHAINWNADRHASGLYLIRMTAPAFSEIRRAVLLK